MSIRSRPMCAADVPDCVGIVASHPIVGPRYSGAVAHLRTAWLGSLGAEAFQGCVFEEVKGSRVRLLGAGVRAFVSDDFVREIKTPPFFWIGPELARRTVAGRSPLLSDREVREANATGGLTLLFWEACMRHEDSGRLEVLRQNGEAIVSNHRGFLIKEWIMQAAGPLVLRAMIFAGACSVRHDNGAYAPVSQWKVGKLFSTPHVIGLTRELARARAGSWASNLFVYQPPRFGLRPSEKRLLLAALQGTSDEQLSREVGVSASAVKKHWHSIYERVQACDPALLPQSTDARTATGRGKTKKHLLLAYLREHPEELRPVARHLLPEPAREGVVGLPRAGASGRTRLREQSCDEAALADLAGSRDHDHGALSRESEQMGLDLAVHPRRT